MQTERVYSEEELEQSKKDARQKYLELECRNLQSGFFGARNVGATLSKGRLNTVKWPEVSQQILDFTKRMQGFLIISSPPGVGKTYFCSALLDYFFWKGIDTYCISERDFLERLRQGMAEGKEYHTIIKYICDHQVFILDDLGSTGMTEWRERGAFRPHFDETICQSTPRRSSP